MTQVGGAVQSGARSRAADRPRFLRTCWADLAALADLKGTRFPSAAGLVDVLMLPGAWAVLLFRLSNLLHRWRLRPLSRMVYFANLVLFGVDLRTSAEVGPGLQIPHPVGVAFGGARIGRNAHLMCGARLTAAGYEDQSRDGFPTLGDDVWVMDSAKVIGPVTVGDRAVVSINAVVTRDVPANAIVIGHPARVVRYRDSAEGGAPVSEEP